MRLYELTENKERQLTERENVLEGSKQAIREAFDKDMQEIQEELEREYRYINERG